jgi:hypothetical protein
MPEATATQKRDSKPSQTTPMSGNPAATGATPPLSEKSSQTSATGSTTQAKPSRERSKSDPNESSAAKFRRLGNARVNAALHRIKLVGNLSGYKHDEDDAANIVDALNEAVREVDLKFKSRQRGDAKRFSL